MITIRNTQRSFPVDIDQITTQIKTMLKAIDYTDFDIGIWLTTDKTIRKYNHEFRNKDRATDILSFPYHTYLQPGERIVVGEDEDRNLGDIIISLAYVARTAHKWERDFSSHLTALLAHGIAHLLNYDHQTDTEFAVMQKVEAKLLAALSH